MQGEASLSSPHSLKRDMPAGGWAEGTHERGETFRVSRRF